MVEGVISLRGVALSIVSPAHWLLLLTWRNWHREKFMYGNSSSEFGKIGSRKMDNSAALEEARGWASALMDHEFKGRGDREKSIRYRLSRKIGVPESYLYRLQYKTREMKDVAGSVYRALMIAYNNACEKNEAAAARYRAERLGLRGNHETAGEKLDEQIVGTAASGSGP